MPAVSQSTGLSSGSSVIILVEQLTIYACCSQKSTAASGAVEAVKEQMSHLEDALNVERAAHAKTRDRMNVNLAAHAVTQEQMTNERAAHAATKEQMKPLR